MSSRMATRQIHKLRKVVIERRLPIPGEILVRKGQRVSEADAIGRMTLHNAFAIINVARVLSLPETNIGPFLQKNENDALEEGEVIAEYQNRFPFSKKVCRSPVTGRVAAIAGKWLLIETDVEVQVVEALVAGRVVDIYPSQGVIIETVGAYVEATCGLGGETYGLLQNVSDDPEADIDEEALTLMTQPTILLAGGTITERAVRRAEESRIAGVIVGSIDAALLEMDPPPQISVVATEGFGNRPMALETWNVLHTRLNNVTSLQGFMPSMMRPAIIIPDLSTDGLTDASAPLGYASVGSQVRTLREPNAMAWGHISAIPEKPQTAVGGAPIRGAVVNFPHGSQFVPWLNLEQIGS